MPESNGALVQNRTWFGLRGVVALSTLLILLSFGTQNSLAQCKKSSSTCNLTNLRNAFTTKGYQELGCGADSCSIYFIDPTARTNQKADSIAQSLGAHLVSFQNLASNDSVVKWANTAGFSGSVWTGYNDKANEGKFIWSDGRDTTFKNWATGQPNGGASEDCGALQLTGSDSGKWVDTSCTILLRSIIRVSLCMTINVQDTSVCLNDSVNLIPIVSSGSPSYTFTWNPASLDSVFKVSPNTSLKYSVTATDRYGCTAEDTARVVVDTLPTFDFVTDTVCRGDSILFDLKSGYTSYAWSTGDTTQKNELTDSLTYWARRTDQNGCSYTDTFKIINNTLPLFSLSNDTNVCSGDSIIYKAPFSHSSYSYKWHDNSTADSIVIKAGVTVQLEVTDSNGCKFKNGPEVTLAQKPSINLGPDRRLCENTSINILDTTPQTTTRWIFNNDTTLGSASVTIDTSGTLFYYMTAANGCPGFDTVVFSLDTVPIVNLGNDTNLCLGDSITLDAGPGMATYNWSTGDTSQTIKIGATNSYRVFVTDRNGCETNDFMILTIDSLPEFQIRRNGFLGDTSICLNDSVRLTVDTSQHYVYSWNGSPFVAGDDSQYVSTASQNIVMIKDTNDCVFSDTLNVSLDTLPIVNLRTDTTICDGDSILLRVNGDTNYHHIWNGVNRQKLDSMWVKNDTSYIIELIDRNTTCRQKDTVKIEHDTIPIISLGGDTTFCVGDTIVLDAGDSLFSYKWSTTDTTQTISISSPGVFSVNVVDSNGCKASTFRRVFMSQLPTPNLGQDIGICKGTPVSEVLNAGGGYAFYEWSSTKMGADTTFQKDTVTTQGMHWVKVTDSVGCSAYDTININANFLPKIELGPDTFFCSGDKFNFLIGAGPGFKKYEWFDFTNFPNVVQLQSQGQILLITDTAARVFCRITDINDCTNQDTISIIENPVPVIDLGVTTFYCEADRPRFIDSLRADSFNIYKSYKWSTGDSTETYVATEGGKYSVTVTANNGCENSDEKEIIEIAQPVVDFSADTLYCEGAPVVLDAYTDGYLHYYWYKLSEVAGIEDQFLNPLIEPIDSGWHDTTISKFTVADEGRYKVVIKYGQFPGCADSAEAEIRKDINPEIDFGIRNPDTTLCAGEVLTLQPNFFGKGSTTDRVLFEWQDGVEDSTYDVRFSGLYQLVMTNDCGADIQDIQVNFEDCSNLWIPNSFTPNDDGDNDRWSVKSLEGFFEFHLQVFDNFGRIVWETTLPEVEWDGTHITNGKPQPNGTYVYRLTYRSKFELVEGVNSAATKEITGEIHLFR